MKTKYLKIILILYTVVIAFTLLTSTATGKSGNIDKYAKGYPDSFDGKGIIIAFNLKNNHINISDISFYLSPRATFNTPTLLDASPGWFRKGQKVGYVLDDSGNIESLWLLKENS